VGEVYAKHTHLTQQTATARGKLAAALCVGRALCTADVTVSADRTAAGAAATCAVEKQGSHS
jgi:hypothetical protein